MTKLDPPRDASAPSLAAHLKWSALMIAIVVVIGLLASPILRWLGFE